MSAYEYYDLFGTMGNGNGRGRYQGDLYGDGASFDDLDGMVG